MADRKIMISVKTARPTIDRIPDMVPWYESEEFRIEPIRKIYSVNGVITWEKKVWVGVGALCMV